MPALLTERLRLVPVTLEMIDAVVRQDHEAAERVVGAAFPPGWPNEQLISSGFPFSIAAIRAAPDVRLWGDSLVLMREGPPRVVGSVVFAGRPEHGIADVGYAIEEGSRSQGLASEATGACVEWALAEPGIEAVQATTFHWHHA